MRTEHIEHLFDMATSAVNIRVKMPPGNVQKFKCEKTSSILSLKKQIAEEAGIPLAQMRFVLKGKPLKDADTIGKLKLKEGALITFLINLK